MYTGHVNGYFVGCMAYDSTTNGPVAITLLDGAWVCLIHRLVANGADNFRAGFFFLFAFCSTLTSPSFNKEKHNSMEEPAYC